MGKQEGRNLDLPTACHPISGWPPSYKCEEPTVPCFIYIYFLALYPVSPTGSSLSLNTLGRGSQLYSEEPWVPLEMPQSYLGEEKRKKSSSQCSRVDTPDSI